jgi:hypothetical protein
LFYFLEGKQIPVNANIRIFLAIIAVEDFFELFGILATQTSSAPVAAEFILLLQLTSLPSCGG